MAESGTSLTGSSCGAPTTHRAAVSIALGRLRGMITLCCMIASLALVAQIVICAIVSFTELRWSDVTASAPPLVVTAEADDAEEPIRKARSLDEVSDEDPVEVLTPVDPNRVHSSIDGMMNLGSTLARMAGAIGTVLLLPLIGIGVLLAASSATDGIDRTVTAFSWACIVALLTLPVGAWIGLPWGSGAMWSYAELTSRLDAGGGPSDGLIFFARYLVLPGCCALGLMFVATRFSAGVKAGLMQRESFQLDATLEQEAGNVKATSLHGSRNAAAFEQASRLIEQQNQQGSAPLRPTGTTAPDTPPPADGGDSTYPRRLI